MKLISFVLLISYNIHFPVWTTRFKDWESMNSGEAAKNIKVEFFPDEITPALTKSNINKMTEPKRRTSEKTVEAQSGLKVEFFPDRPSTDLSNNKLTMSNGNTPKKIGETEMDFSSNSVSILNDTIFEEAMSKNISASGLLKEFNKRHLPIYDIEFNAHVPQTSEIDYEGKSYENPGVVTELERIIGGNDASEAHFPWMVRIFGGCARNNCLFIHPSVHSSVNKT